MKVLQVAGGLPTEERPYYQPFIKAQIDSLIKKGIDIEVLDIRGYNSSLNYIKSIKDIRRIVKSEKIDLIHAHYVYCGISSLLAKSGKPIVISFMGSDLLGISNVNGYTSLRGKIDSSLSKFIANYMDCIIVKSIKMKNQLNTKVPIHVIPNGVNLDLFKPYEKNKLRKDLGLEQKKFLILFLGNTESNMKNFTLAKESVDLFKRRFETKSIKFIAPFGISQAEVVKYMGACDVLLLTSHKEGSPNVIKEAMACNLPVISTDVGDVNEIISGTKNCFIIPFDVEKIAQKLEIVFRSEQRSNGREMITHLKDEIIAEKIIKIYTTLLNKK